MRDFSQVWAAAEAMGLAAGAAAKPRAMVVSSGDQSWFVGEGACGFAWVVVRPGNSAFAKWCRKHKGSRSEYGGGECVKWVGEFNQSMERKERYAQAFAGVLCAAGVNAVARSRMD